MTYNYAVDNPNFSIIVPAGCNAKCEFCFWKQPKDSLAGIYYLKRLDRVLKELPSQFTQCSITGGEPTTCGLLREILTLVRLRFDKVVMSSNGYNIQNWMFDYIDHLNISRHDYVDANNERIFATDTVPDTNQLTRICELANLNGVDVTINTVLAPDFDDVNFIDAMVQFTKVVNANAICFRKEHSDIEPMPVEDKIRSKVTFEHSCGVCKVKERLIQGVKTTWRYSVLEPSQELGAIYELVFHANGKLTLDWEASTSLEAHLANNVSDDEDYFDEDLTDEQEEVLAQEVARLGREIFTVEIGGSNDHVSRPLGCGGFATRGC